MSSGRYANDPRLPSLRLVLWIEHELERLGREYDWPKQVLAERMGISPRLLEVWRSEVSSEGIPTFSYRAASVEEALASADVHLSEVYPPLDPGPSTPNRGGVPKGYGAKLSDPQIRVLHRFHDERKVTIVALAEQVWRGAGFKSAGAAEFAIRSGFKRLGLPAFRHPRSLARRCKATRDNGRRCKLAPLYGSELCVVHHPENREAWREKAKRNLGIAA